ncbi:MAG: enoyl-CoA hydratase/isomerase family protein [Conexivisphaerales archaeon]
MYQNLLVKKEGKVYWIILSRKTKANAINLDMWKNLREELTKASSDPEVRVIALTGDGKYFSAGEDLNDLKDAKAMNSSVSLFLDSVRPVFDLILKSPKVVISVVNGPAVGAAVELVFASDIAIADSSSFFMLSQGRVGVGPALSLSLGVGVVGRKRLLNMLLTGRKVGADEALQWGMINEVYTGNPTDTVNRYAEEISRVPEILIRITKEIIARQLYLLDYNSSFREIAMFIHSEEARLGIDSFLSKKR